MALTTVWFILIGVLWAGYFLLEGFDFGVGILLPVLGRTERERRLMINTIGPVWDGNEVWLIVAGGATFAAFPEWYATLFSGFYLPLLLVLIGLGAKNALLRVTFAVELRKQGKSIIEATVLAGEMRLRPIIMTSLAFVFGVLPLALAMGAGANARHSIGTGIIGGMIGETTLAMLYVPLFFYLFDQLTEKLAERKKAKEEAKGGGQEKDPPGHGHARATGEGD